MWKLVIEDDEGKRTVVPLSREQYSIGRKDGNTIRLTERNVSREHARIVKVKKGNGSSPGVSAAASNGSGDASTDAHEGDKPGFMLEDLTSYNGVFVNGLRITHAQDLAHGDLVQIGDYRIVLQDESLLDVAAGVVSDPKQTVPQAPNARAAALLDRPHRFVMLAGPTPGAEFPLDSERMTIGRAEDAGISINHNSVSRLHCEVHALGDGRFEIVDKGSSNGVRVNGSDLRRGIVEPGDVIELGDVKFKFIGAGQIFRPTESQQLALLGDRAAAELAGGKRSGTTALPIAIFAVVVVAGALGAWVYTRPRPDAGSPPSSAMVSPDQATLDDARRKCASGDCETAHDELAGLPAGSPVRSSSDFKDIESRWADQELAKGDAETDSGRKHRFYQRVAQDVAVDAGRRKAAADKLQALDTVAAFPTTTPTSLPVASATDTTELAPKPDAKKPPTLADPASLPPTTTMSPAPAPAPAPTTTVATAPTKAPGNADDRERQQALQASTPDAKAAFKSQLEQKVYSGRASDTEIRMLIATCKELGDKMCVAQARQIQQQRSQ
jgi:pSer/pThr/pTyr-binding forkhead associated (FHA) protein